MNTSKESQAAKEVRYQCADCGKVVKAPPAKQRQAAEANP